MVLREGFDSPCLQQWIEHYQGDKSAVEAMMNHLHIGDIHYHDGAEATHERVVHLGRTLRQIYECKLRSQFPEKDIIVEFDDSPKADIIDYQLTFFQRGIVRG